MTSTYSSSLRLELMATGDQSGTWGDTTNTNLGTLLEQAITGYLSVAQGDVANLTLTTTNGASDQARNAVVRITGALTATRNVVVQTANKLYTIANDTTGGFSIVVKTSGGTGVSVPPGAMVDVYSNGTNVVQAANYWSGSIGGAVYLDAGAAAGPNYDLFRDSTSPAISDILGRVTFNGRDSAANKQEYGSIEAVIVSPTSTTENGALDFYVTKAGTRTKYLSLTAAATAFTGAAAYSFDAPLSASTTAAGALETLTSTDAGATTGPNLQLNRYSASPAAADFGGGFTFGFNDVTPTNTNAIFVRSRLVDASAGAISAAMDFVVKQAGTDTGIIDIRGDALGLSIGRIEFPTAQNPSTDAHTLDDYEEAAGSFGITFGGSASGVTGTLSYVYVKIGRSVSITGSVTLTNNGSGTGAAVLTGFPFTAFNAVPVGGMAVTSWSGMSGVVGNPTIEMIPNTTTANIKMSGATASVAMTDTNITNTGAFKFSGVYLTDQ